MNKQQRSYFNTGNMIEKGWSVLSAFLLDLICVLCFLYSARLMYDDVYGYGSMETEFVFRIIVMVLAISLLSVVADSLGGLFKVLIRVGTMAAGLIWLLRYLNVEKNVTRLVSGFYRIATLYIEDWNEFYGTYFRIGDEGRFIYVSDSLNLVMLVLFFILLNVAKLKGKNLVLAVIPYIVFSAVLLTGKIPDGIGVFLMLAGVLLANSGSFRKTDFVPADGTKNNVLSWTSVFSWVRCGLIVVVLFLILTVTQSSLAEETVDEYSEHAKRHTAITVDNTIKKISQISFVKDIELSGDLGEMVNSYAADVDADFEKLNNSSPVYKYEAVLEIALHNRPLADMYLKNFTAGDYEDGVWTRDEEVFAKACKEAGYDAEEVAEDIASLILKKLKLIKNTDNISYISDGNYGNIMDLTYTTAVSYPYAAEMKAQSEVEIKGDSWYSKEATTKTVFVELWNWSGEYEDLSLMLEAGDEEWEDWYEQYVKEHYLAVPENMPYVEKISIELLDHFSYSDNDLEPEEKNAVRLQKAAAVVAWMQENTSYSTDLAELPKGADPVEYFLGTSREGYCMHYASASTLILRTIGVPAKYASGYIAEKSSFRSMYSGYKSTVMDDSAHAWVEIYLEGIGWMPIEVTNSYSAGPDVPIEELPDEKEPTEPTTEPDEPEEPQEEQTTEPSEDPETDPDTDISGTQEEEKEDSSDDEDDKADDKKSSWPIVLVILGILLIILVVLGICCRIPAVRRYIEDREWQYLKEKGPRQAIRIMNRRIYYKLCLRGKITTNNIKDDAYEETLKKHYSKIESSDWERYMELVKAAVFSKREMTEEDMKFCYEIYRQV